MRMPGFRRVFGRLRGDAVRRVDDELQLHIEMKAEDLRRGGLAPDIAEQEARERFGDVRSIRRQCRRTRHRGSGSGTRSARSQIVPSREQSLYPSTRPRREARARTGGSCQRARTARGNSEWTLLHRGATPADRTVFKKDILPGLQELCSLM